MEPRAIEVVNQWSRKLVQKELTIDELAALIEWSKYPVNSAQVQSQYSDYQLYCHRLLKRISLTTHNHKTKFKPTFRSPASSKRTAIVEVKTCQYVTH